LLIKAPMKPQRNPKESTRCPDCAAGNQAKSESGASEVGVPDTTGEKITKITAAGQPP
jgi:hypothetical protein